MATLDYKLREKVYTLNNFLWIKLKKKWGGNEGTQN